MNNLLNTALEAHAAGLCVVPPRQDGSKSPMERWKEYQHRRPDVAELGAWYAKGLSGLGLICGAVSGGLEMLEFEGRAVDEGLLGAYQQAIDAAGLTDVLERVAQGYMEATPRGGVHLLYRCSGKVYGNTALAKRPATADELAAEPDNKVKVLIETRGEGGYVIVAPSAGGVHPEGGAWTQIHGGFATIATITEEERDQLWNVARTFSSVPAQVWQPERSHTPSDGDGPADDYNARMRWVDLLEPEGWRRVYQRDQVTYWCRPGKQKGISASTNHAGADLLHVFTSSTAFEADRSYTKFQAYAVIRHGGDLSLAGKALYAEGYGERRKRVSETAVIDEWTPPETEEQDVTEEVQAPDDGPKPDEDLDEFLNSDDPEYDWLVPNLLERGDRLIVTGPEGGGKSVLLRQMGVQMGSGIHPFTLEPMEPVSVLIVDVENSKRQVRRGMRLLRPAAGRLLRPGMVRIRVVPQGINLGNPIHQEWFERRLIANRPDVLIIGPLYKLADGDPTEEKTAKPVAMFLDKMRATYAIAIIIEAHTPHSATAGGKRPERPYGWSGWLRWPEFGLHLARDGTLTHWRGPRDERDWPSLMKRGGEWMWTVVTDPVAVRFAEMVAAVKAAGEELSTRDLATRLGTSKSSVDRAMNANRPAWNALLNSLKDT